MIQFCDHAILAQLGTADMRLPIQYALSYPKRLAMLDAKPFLFLGLSAAAFCETR